MSVDVRQYIEQFVGCQSLSAMIAIQARLRFVDLTGIALILMWLVSPIGGQASLRLLSTRIAMIDSAGQISFANLSATEAITFSAITQGSTYQTTMNGLYTISLLSPLSVKDSPQDPWGNLKIPTFETLRTSADEFGFKPTPEKDDNTDWVSLLGLPITGLKQGASLTSTISASYYYVNCSSITGLNGSSNWPAELGAPNALNNTNFWGSSQFKILFMNNTDETGFPESSSLGMLLTTWSGDIISSDSLTYPSNVTVANCTIQPSFVDVKVACKDLLCRAKGVRRSSQKRPPRKSPAESVWWGSLLSQMSDVQEEFLNLWAAADNSTNAGQISPTLSYLGGAEAFPFLSPATGTGSNGAPAAPRLYELNLNDVTRRLRTLLNTYWQSSLGTLSYNGTVARNSPALMTPSEIDVVSPTLIMNLTDAVFQQRAIVYECDTVWFTITLLTSSFLLVISVVGLVARCACVGPDLLNSFTTALRMNPDSARCLNGDNSTLDSGTVAKANKDLVVALQDMRPGQDVGLVSIGVLGDGLHQVQTIADVRRRDEARFYE